LASVRNFDVAVFGFADALHRHVGRSPARPMGEGALGFLFGLPFGHLELLGDRPAL
jgi:hypothetical protein